ncbi:MAG: PAAR domain-containing protein [Stenotrophomonas sp.]
MLIVVGDALQRGGAVLSGSPHTDIDGRAVARVGDKVLCTRHGAGAIVTGDPTLLIDGQAVARNGDKASCGCVLLAGKQPLVHVSQGRADGAASVPVAAAVKTGRFVQAPSPQRPASSSVGTATPSVEPTFCWLKDHSGQVLEYPDGRYFEASDVDGAIDFGLVASFRIDVPLKSGGDIVVTAKIRIAKQGRISDKDVETAKERLLRGVDKGINNKFTLHITDGECGTRIFPIRYVVEFVSRDEDYVMLLYRRYPREKVSGSMIHVSVETDAWVHLHEFMHALGLPDEYMNKDEPERAIKFFMPNRIVSPEVVVTRSSREKSDPHATLMSDHHNTTVKPRHAWNIGLEVQDLLNREIGREVSCIVTCSS